MKFLYIAPLPIDMDNVDGVPKKILAHVKVLSEKYDVSLLYYFNGQVWLYNEREKNSKPMCKGTSKLHVLRFATKHIKEQNAYRGVYIRYPKSDFIFISLLKALKKENIPVVIEIPTYPYDMEGKESLKGRLIAFMDCLYRKKLKKYVDRIVTFSGDEEIFGVKTIRTINGIDFDLIPCYREQIDVKKEIKLIAVSAMYRVHGFERLIEGLHDYYDNGGERNVRLELVGAGDECSKYKELTSKYGLETRVIFRGKVFGQDLNELYKGVAMGINSLAIHRQGLKTESTLKTREYVAHGLPVLSSSYVDAFDDEGNAQYIMRIPPDETAVDVKALIAFVESLYEDKETVGVRKDIRNKAYTICDMRFTMQPIIDFIEQKYSKQ